MSEDGGVKNKPLVDAMRLLAKERDDWHRKQVYQEILRAQFVVALSRPFAAGQQLQIEDLKVVDKLGSRPSFAVFTEEALARRWRPDHEHFGVVGGVPLILMLSAAKAGSLLINRGGKVGGEVYGNEIDTMAQAVTGTWARQS